MNAIAVNANNLDLFRALIWNLPEEVEDDLFCIFTDTRLGDKTKELEEILKSSQLNLNYRVFTNRIVYDKLAEIMPITDFAESYTMSINMLMYWFCFKFNKKIDGLLVIDDDVILSKSINNLFDGEEKYFVDKLCRTGLKTAIANGSSTNVMVFDEIIEGFGGGIFVDDVVSLYINGGHKLHYRRNANLELYERGLKGFFNSEFLEGIWLQRRSYRTQFLDERFDNVYLTFMNVRNNILYETESVRFFNMSVISDNILLHCRQRPIVHVCNGKWKESTYQKLNELGVIKW